MALDNFIPKNAIKQCNECIRRKDFETVCVTYPNGIPKKVMFSNNCPDFEPKEPKEK